MSSPDKTPVRSPRILHSLGILLGGGLVLLVLCGGLLVWAFPGIDDICANEPLQTSLSPDKKLKAVLFRRDCGATTTPSTHVSILPATDELPNEAGNVCVQGGEPLVNVRWVGDRHLNISSSSAAAVFLRDSEHEGVRITFE
jgi:hypothetical protein